MYIAMKYIQPMSRRTLWPWQGNAVLLKKKDTITSAIQFALKNTAPFSAAKSTQ